MKKKVTSHGSSGAGSPKKPHAKTSGGTMYATQPSGMHASKGKKKKGY